MRKIPSCDKNNWINKRTSRLAANISLIQKNLCPLSFVDVPQQEYVNGLIAIYELNQILSERVIDPFYQKIRTCAQDVPAQDQARFIEIVEKEVMGVHEGNVGRYRVSRLEYAKWLKGWH